jgi:hypothetical protein
MRYASLAIVITSWKRLLNQFNCRPFTSSAEPLACKTLTNYTCSSRRMLQQRLGFHITFAADKYLLLVFGSVIYFDGCMRFFKGMRH